MSEALKRTQPQTRGPESVPAGGSRWQFGDFEFDARAQKLLRHGEPVHLQPQPTRLLQIFLERPGELVTRDELIRTLWAGQVVEFEVSLNFCVRSLRRALDDGASNPRYLETVPKRGYRWIEDVATIEPQAQQRGRRGALLLATATVLVLVAGFLISRDGRREQVDIPPDALAAYLQGSQIFADSERPVEEAMPYFEQAIAAFPDYAAAYASLAMAHYGATGGSNERIDIIRAHTQRALDLSPTNSRAQFMAGMIALRHDFELAAARDHFRRALDDDPRHRPSLHMLALNEAAMGDVEAALEVSRDYATYYPERGLAKAHLGWFELLTGDHASALHNCAAAAELEPTHQVSLQCAADAAVALGLEEARDVHLRGLAATYSNETPARFDAPAFYDWLDSVIAGDPTVDPIERARIKCRTGAAPDCRRLVEPLFADRDPILMMLFVYPEFASLRANAWLDEQASAHGLDGLIVAGRG